MERLFEASQALKSPLLSSTRSVLGEWMMHKVELQKFNNTIEKIIAIVIPLLGMIATLPLWLIGEALEVCTDKGRRQFNYEVNLDVVDDISSISLDPEMTECMGTAVSTFQATRNPEFCEGSALHTALRAPELELGSGVDILTDFGRRQHILRLKEMGANSFRFSVEWADVTRNGLDQYIEAARHFYLEGFKLMITLDHWMGDGTIDCFEKPGDIEAYVKYAEAVYTALRPYASRFLTFNEPNVDAAQKYVMGDLPPKKVGRFWSSMNLVAQKLKAHRAAYERLHLLETARPASDNDEPLQVGLSHQAVCMVAHSRWNILARITAFVITHIFHESFMRIAEQEEMKKTINFLGVQYYARPMAGANGWQPVDTIAIPTKQCPEAWMVDGMKYRFDPEGILPVLQSIYARLNIELMVTETGTAGEIKAPLYNNPMDKRKARYYKVSLQAISKAQKLGVRVTGIFLWTLFDNLEWQHGYKPECAFGILARDRTNGQIEETESFNVIKTIYKKSQPLSFPVRK